MIPVRRQAVALAGCALLLAAGCSSGGSKQAGPSPQLRTLIRKADLPPCPKTDPATTTPGGLPHLVLRCIAGGPAVNLADLRGKPTVVNIYGSWCPPCRAEAGYLSAVADAARARVRFLGVDFQDEDDSALDFAAHVRPPTHYPLVATSDAALIYGNHASGPPVTVFVTPAGTVAGVHQEEYHSAAALRADIRRYLHVSV